MKVIKYEDLVSILKEYGVLSGEDLIPPPLVKSHKEFICQGCGFALEDCVCIHNHLLTELRELTFEVHHA